MCLYIRATIHYMMLTRDTVAIQSYMAYFSISNTNDHRWAPLGMKGKSCCCRRLCRSSRSLVADLATRSSTLSGSASGAVAFRKRWAVVPGKAGAREASKDTKSSSVCSG